MDPAVVSRFRHAALAYAGAGALVIPIVAYAIAATPPPTFLLVVPSYVGLFLLSWGVFARVRWLTRLLAVVVGVRAVLHLLSFIWPGPLFWTVRTIRVSIPLADGSRHPGYLATALLLAVSAWFLARAAWGEPAARVETAPDGSRPSS